MFDWLFDGFWVVYLALGSAGVACAVAWWKTGKKYYAIGFGIVAVLFGIYILLQLLVETASNQMERRVRDMAGSVQSKQIRNVLEKNLSDDFHAGSHDKNGFIGMAETTRDRYGVDSVEVWDLKLVEIDRERRTATFRFKAKLHVKDQDAPFYLVRAVFVMTPKEKWWQKEEWKMRSIEYFNPAVDTTTPLPIP